MEAQSQEKMVTISAAITPQQREWLDAEVLGRSKPGAMESISSVIRSLIDAHLKEREQTSDERARMVVEADGENSSH